VTSPHHTLDHLVQGRDLAEPDAGALLTSLTAPEMLPAMAGALLAALRAKGVTAAEVRGFAGAMRALARKPALPEALDAIDIVGTGGDASGSLNLSTGAALLAAACGLPVVKHGNRSVSSRSGSAAPIRAALGIRTVFNLLGPLTNPAAPRFRLIGAYDAATAELIAGTLAGMNIQRAWVVHGAGGWDEATPIGPFLAFDVTRDAIRRCEIDPRDFGLEPCATGDLAGGDAAANLTALLEVFGGRDHGAHFAALTLQCGLALFIAGRAASIEMGIDIARSAVDSGRADEWLRRLRQFAAERR
jgi:anthranilate phosphoribosyltransferase